MSVSELSTQGKAAEAYDKVTETLAAFEDALDRYSKVLSDGILPGSLVFRYNVEIGHYEVSSLDCDKDGFVYEMDFLVPIHEGDELQEINESYQHYCRQREGGY